MNVDNKSTTHTDPATDGLDLSDPRHQLIFALRRRLLAMQAAENTSTTNSTCNTHKQNTAPQADIAESQPLTAGTQPERSRNAAGTEPEYSAHSAETPPSHSGSPRANRPITESPLDDLPPETQAAILHLLETLSLDAATLEITATPPYGMGIATSRSSLYRFLRRHKTATETRRRQQEAAATVKILSEAKSAGEISITASHLIAIRLLETAIVENSDPNHLLSLSKAFDRLRAAEYSERRLRLAEEKAKSKSSPSVPKAPRENSPPFSPVPKGPHENSPPFSPVPKGPHENSPAFSPVPKGQHENSPAFQRREPCDNQTPSPEGTTEIAAKISE
jgi:hypothetical protein